MDSDLISRIRALEVQSRALEPSAAVRATVTQSVLQDFAEEFVTKLEHDSPVDRLPAWVPFDSTTVATHVASEGLPESGCIGGSGGSIDEEEWRRLFALLQKDIVEPGINPASPGMLAYVPGGGVFGSNLADFISATTNRFAGMFFASPGAVRIENMIVRWAAEVMGLGYDHALPYDSVENTDRHHINLRLRRVAGCLTSGASIATLSAFVCAREAHGVLSGGKYGSTPPNRFVVYMTDQVHSCIPKALNIIGATHVVRRTVPRDASFRMIPAALEELVEADIASGLTPWLLVMTAGTTNTGSVDPLVDLATIGRKFSMWVHCDGAYGGLLALCPEGAALMGERCKGIAMADSVAADPHKALYLPYGTGLLCVRNGDLLVKTHSVSAAYISRFVDSTDEVSSTDTSVELTRHFRALRVWLPLRLFGIAPFRAAQSEKFYLAQYFYERIHLLRVGDSRRFVASNRPQTSIVMYRLETVGCDNIPSVDAQNELNLAVVKGVLAQQRVFISSTQIDGVLYLRLAIGVFRTHIAHIDEAIDCLLKAALLLVA